VVSETGFVLPDTAWLVSAPSRKRFYPLFASAKRRGRASGAGREGVGQRLKISHVRIRLFVLDDLVRGLLCKMGNGNGHLRWRSRIELEVFRTRNVRRQLGPIYRVPTCKRSSRIERGTSRETSRGMQKDILYRDKGSDGRRTTKACLLGAERKLTFHCWQRVFGTSLSPTTRDSVNLEDDPLRS